MVVDIIRDEKINENGIFSSLLNLAIVQKNSSMDNDKNIKEWLSVLTGKEIILNYK